MDYQFLQPLSYLVAIGVFIWYLRKDSKDDYIKLEQRLEAWRLESREEGRRIESLITVIKDEIKDFHGRLCAIEERRKMEKE